MFLIDWISATICSLHGVMSLLSESGLYLNWSYLDEIELSYIGPVCSR